MTAIVLADWKLVVICLLCVAVGAIVGAITVGLAAMAKQGDRNQHRGW